MPYDRLTDAEIESGEFILASTAKKVQGNEDFFAGQIGTLAAIQISNGSFEIASDAAQPNLPDNWELSRFPNGVFVLDTTLPRHGGKIAKFTHPSGAGNGGGQLISDYFETTPDRDWRLWLSFWATNAAVRIQFIIQYFDEDQVSLGADETLYNNNSSNPTSVARRSYNLTVPAGARYLKVKLVGGATDTNPGVSTDIYFDDVMFDNEHNFETGTVVFASSLVLDSTVLTTLTKSKEIVLDRDGDISTSFDLQDIGAGNGEARVYVNGSPAGTLRINGGVGWLTYTENLTGLEKGDLVQLYFRHSTGASAANIRNFKLMADQPIQNAVTQEII